MPDFNPHELPWTDQQIKRFWNWMSNEPAFADQYFSYTLGEAIVRYALKHGLSHTGLVLDFGCGLGHLMQRILEAGVPCSGVEFSPSSADRAINTLQSFSGFRGITLASNFPLPLASDSFDFIFLIETIEHLRTEQIAASLREIHRLLRPGGRLMITTPNQENLAVNKVLCPDCGSIFHRMQHLRSLNPESLQQETRAAGFTTIVCEGTTLLNPSLVNRAMVIYRAFKRMLFGVLPPKEHLVYIGAKT